MKILITGVAGLIGSNFADWIIENTSHTVIGIDNLTGGIVENVNREVLLYTFDLTKDFNEIDRLIQHHNIDIIYHFAAYAAEGLSPFIRKFNYINNLIATTNLVNMAIKYSVKRFVFTSSMAVYGRGKSPFKESLLPSPIDPYGIAKFACEQDIKVASDQHNLNYCIVRPHNVYGPKQIIWDKYRNVLGIWFLQCLKGKSLTIFGDGKQKRIFTYIGDILEQLYLVGFDPRFNNQTFNIGSTEQEYSIEEAAKLLIEVVGDECKNGDLKYTDQRFEVREATVSHEKLRKIIGDIKETNLHSGLKQMWDWVKLQPLEKKLQFPEYELKKGIYTVWKI